MPRLLLVSALAYSAGSFSEVHDIWHPIPDSSPAFPIDCQPECTLPFILSPPLQKNIEEETASQHANRFKDQQGHDASSS